jgi:aspartate kinase
MLLSVGERVSIALLAMAIQERNFPAISFTGSQVGIITSTDHTRARILEIKGDRIRQELNAGKIVVVAGYQGVSTEKEITTLGRGGSDTTAVALAAALNAEKCEIMTDVDGVYTANPRIVEKAKRLSEVSYDEMLELADTGAQVLKASAVEFAKRHNIEIHVGSSFTGKIGTIITDGKLDKNRVTGIAVDKNISLLNLTDSKSNSSLSLIKTLAREGIAVKFIVQMNGMCSIVLNSGDLNAARELILKHPSKYTFRENKNFGVLSIVGVGINFGTDVMSKITESFDRIGITPRFFNFSETRLSFGVKQDELSRAANHIHSTLFG